MKQTDNFFHTKSTSLSLNSYFHFRGLNESHRGSEDLFVNVKPLIFSISVSSNTFSDSETPCLSFIWIYSLQVKGGTDIYRKVISNITVWLFINGNNTFPRKWSHYKWTDFDLLCAVWCFTTIPGSIVENSQFNSATRLHSLLSFQRLWTFCFRLCVSA